MREIVLIRGLPGSGKTTLAQRMVRDLGYAHCETDSYFVGSDGAYRFDGDKLKDAHNWCQDRALALLQAGLNVVVSNTFVKLWEMEAYYRIAASIGCNVRVVVATGEYQNVHGVPQDVIDRMRLGWQQNV